MEFLIENNNFQDKNDVNMIDSDNNCNSDIQNSVEIKGPPIEIINKLYYYELYDDDKKKIYINVFEFCEKTIKIYFYNDYSFTDFVRLEEHSNENITYNSQSKILILDINDGFVPYILKSKKQGKFNRKIETMIFNEDFTFMTTNTKYFEFCDAEINALVPYLQSNNFIINFDESYIVSKDKLYSINLPINPDNKYELDIPYILDGYFPPEIIEKKYYFYFFDSENKTNYISVLIFSEDKLSEILYNDNTLSEINTVHEYPIGNFTYYTKYRNIILEENYDINQHINPILNECLFEKKITSLILNEDFTLVNKIEKYINIHPSKIISIKPILDSKGYIVDDNNTSIKSNIITYKLNLSTEQFFDLNIQQNLIESNSKIQYLNKDLVNYFSISKNENNENVILFNDVQYSLNNNIGLCIGVYKINEIPVQFPLGFVINNENKFKILEGKESGMNIVDGLFVMHYVGNIKIEVLGDFGNISYHCHNYGYMGGKNRLKFIYNH